ncbi:MAG TPA: DUF2851 family protein [Candidatus Hydrogenedentes bacterium]|nr:DUF2851 family protein [Candidatus Hydrogenedentota bacterium]HQM50228.1 DUF2851 family protein [Candidatus Hydrogenedentota bacterium]
MENALWAETEVVAAGPGLRGFSREYEWLNGMVARGMGVAEGGAAVPETVLQCIWYDQLIQSEGLILNGGQRLRVVFPGWWNQNEGPDFRDAQLEIDGAFLTGDVEVHQDLAAWRQHGHHQDSRYDNVVLEVVGICTGSDAGNATSRNRAVPYLPLESALLDSLEALAEQLRLRDYPYHVPASYGECARLTAVHGVEPVLRLLRLAGEWRMLAKARDIAERIERAGEDQAVYEAVMAACGYGPYKHQFRALAQQIHYDRVRQLGVQDPFLVEAAFLQLAGLLPESLPEGNGDAPHFRRLQALREQRLRGLRRLPMKWTRNGVRPNNYPERRLAGAARFLGRTAKPGLSAALDEIWQGESKPVKRRLAFEALFPTPLGFWAERCTWTGKPMPKPTAMIGRGRVHAIIGNVFVPVALAKARYARDRALETKVFDFFTALPKEMENHVFKTMASRLFGDTSPPRFSFQTQQGLIQLYTDWCRFNPKCGACPALSLLKLVGESR